MRGAYKKIHFQQYFEYVRPKNCLVVDRQKKTKSNEEAIIVKLLNILSKLLFLSIELFSTVLK